MADNELLQVAVPILPEHIIEQLKGAEVSRGEYTFVISGFNAIIPALTVSRVDLDLTPLVYIFYKHHTLTSSFYDPTFTFQFRIDDTKLDLTPFGVPFDSQKELTLSYFLAAKRRYTYIFANPFFFDINVGIYFETIRMQRSLYENWYRLILQASQEKLNELAVNEGGSAI